MNTINTETLIIGAGPAGLSCAMKLSEEEKDFIVIEKESGPGGLSRTYHFKESDGLSFYTDNGPHRFFSKNHYLYSFIEGLIQEDWIKVRRHTSQYIDGKFYDYPVNAFQALKNIGLLKSCMMFLDYLFAKAKFSLFRKEILSFNDYAISNFGKSLADFNIINYTEKIWGISADNIHPDWAKQRIKGLNLKSLFINTLTRFFKFNSNSPKTLVDEFFYPSKGTGLIYDTIVSKIKEKGYKVIFNLSPNKVIFNENNIEVILVNEKKEEIRIICKNLVESIPITKFIQIIEPRVPKKIIDAVSNLKHRSQVYLFITLNKDKITNDQWIYFPSKKDLIARVSEMKNFSEFMSPKGKTSLFIEFFCFEGDDIWNSSKDELLKIAMESLKDFFDKSDIRQSYLIKKKDVYPVYDLNYKYNLNIIKEYLDTFSNLYYIGRPGRFRYNNQDHSLEMGMLAAKSIIKGVKFDMDMVGNEDEYYEKGNTPIKKDN